MDVVSANLYDGAVILASLSALVGPGRSFGMRIVTDLCVGTLRSPMPDNHADLSHTHGKQLYFPETTSGCEGDKPTFLRSEPSQRHPMIDINCPTC
jgi:hypothetical protein